MENGDQNTAFNDTPHRRYNPLKDEWVLVSPHRNKRPWQGRSEDVVSGIKMPHSLDCYLCAGNTRANGLLNPNYSGPFVFQNDYPAILEDTPKSNVDNGGIFRAQSARGTARVICFSERHDLTLPEMTVSNIRKVIELWAEQTSDLGKRYQWVAVFENKGALMGCSNPHPHGQIWASDFLPNEIMTEDKAQSDYFKRTGDNLLLTYAQSEAREKTRTVVENKHWLAVVPYWAAWPYETLLLPKRRVARLPDLGVEERRTLAEILKRLCTRYDNLFETEFPYSMGWHGAPFNQEKSEHWQLHAHFFPPLLRSATVRKFMVGYELLAEVQRDITAETAAAHLRDLSDQHYNLRDVTS